MCYLFAFFKFSSRWIFSPSQTLIETASQAYLEGDSKSSKVQDKD